MGEGRAWRRSEVEADGFSGVDPPTTKKKKERGRSEHRTREESETVKRDLAVVAGAESELPVFSSSPRLFPALF